MRDAFFCRDQTKPSALATAFFARGFWAPMETNWSRVGSGQQYQGSLRNGTPAWDRVGGLIFGADNPAAAWAALQLGWNVAGRASFCRSAAAANPSTDSTALITKRQPVSRSAGKCFSNLSKCSILMVTSYVTTGNSR